MIHQKQESNSHYPKVKDTAETLIHAHLKFVSKREAIQAAIITATFLATETSKPEWYRVVVYLEDKEKIKYGQR